MIRLIIGIDPGSKGAAVPLVDGLPVLVGGRPLAALWPNGGPDTRVRALAGLTDALRRRGHLFDQPNLVVIERVAINYHGRSQQGMAQLIEEAGGWVALCAAWEWLTERRLAGAWLGDVAYPREGWPGGIKPKKGAEKVRALAAARRWWPQVDWRPVGGKHRKPHDGLVDAALLALTAHLDVASPGSWTVERDGTGRGWRRVYPDPKQQDARGCSFRAQYTFEAAVAKATRGAARLLCDGEEVRRWTA